MFIGLLSLMFALTAMVYSSVGFGGGSTYLALLVLFGLNYNDIPIVGLLCNILVVIGSCWHYLQRYGNPVPKLWPFLLTSIPCALLGGTISLSLFYFQVLLSMVLFCVALSLVFLKGEHYDKGTEHSNSIGMAFCIGALIGCVSGVVGIGGGIFLSPILILGRWMKTEQVVAHTSVFIALNSVAGLGGHLFRGVSTDLLTYAPLGVAVLIGGQLGNHIHVHWLKVQHLKSITAMLILMVAFKLAWRSIAEL